MNSILDTIGSFIVAGIIMLLIIASSLNMNSASVQAIENSLVQTNAAVNSIIFDYDLYKIGYRVPSNKITLADSNRIKYKTDFDNNSTIDSIEYKIGLTDNLYYTTNPHDRIIYKKINNDSYVNMGVVSKFIFSYYDSVGTQLSYQSLSNQSNRNLIRMLKILATFESSDSNYSFDQAINWTKLIRPKNLK